jgi:predicted NBD/HSP70 family sugar kinase
LVFVRADIGLKAGIIINDALYDGEMGAAGEIGNNVIVYKNPENDTVSIDKAETLLTLDAIIYRISENLPKYPSDILNAFVGIDKTVTMTDIQKALSSESSFVNNIVKETGTLLGYVIANMAATLDIAIVIIGGDIVKLNHHIFKPLREAVSEAISPAPAPTIISSILGEDVALWGAAYVGLESVIQKLTEPNHK